MPPLSPSAFADALAGLDPDALARFVADLERARGRTATVEGGAVVVGGDGEPERRLLVHDPGWLNRPPDLPPDADAVVTPLRDPDFSLDPDVSVTDADDLRDVALYGVPAAKRDRLFADHLGLGPAATDDGAGGGGTTAAVAAVAVLVVGAVALGAAGVAPQPSASEGSDATPVAAGTPGTTGTPVDDGRYPPGVTEEGVVDPALLGRAHETALAGESYVLVSDRSVRYANGTLRSRLAVRVRLAADRGYLARAETAGPHAPVFLGRPPARGVYWSNGTVYARRLTRDGERVYNTFDPSTGLTGAGTWKYWTTTVAFGGSLGDPERTYGRFLGAVPVRVARTKEPDGRRRYVLHGEADAVESFRGGADARNLTLSASVTGDDVVRSFRVRYRTTVDGKRVVVRWVIRYEGVGRTTVDRPPWLDRALRGERVTVESAGADDGPGGNVTGRDLRQARS